MNRLFTVFLFLACSACVFEVTQKSNNFSVVTEDSTNLKEEPMIAPLAPDPLLIGQWTLTHYNQTPVEESESYHLLLLEDSQVHCKGSHLDAKGFWRYSMQGETRYLTLDLEVANEEHLHKIIKLNQQELVIKDKDDLFTFKRINS